MEPEPGPETHRPLGLGAAFLRGERTRTLGAWLVALVAVLAVWHTRVDLTHRIPNWNRKNPVGLMKSDPALLFWFTQRIAENGGAVPEDFAHTTAVQWPDAVDARVEFPLAQTWLAANTWRWFGGTLALHEWCMVLFSLLAALTGFGVFGLARELSGSRVLALVALLAWCLLLGGWRSTGYILLGEDLSFPAYAVHLWLLARAARVRTPAAFLLSGVFLVVALMSWHAAGFFVVMEAAALFAWTLRSGENPLRTRHAWLVLLPFVLGCLVEPMLRGKLQFLSLPMQVAVALAALAWIEGRRERAGHPARGLAARVVLGLGLLVGASGLAFLATRAIHGGLGDYSHVLRLISAKLQHLGQLPEDPRALPFEVRILWQGPFDTIDPSTLLRSLGTGLLGGALLAAVSFPFWWRGRGRGADAVLALFMLAALLSTWLIQRTVVLAAVVLPVASVVAAARLFPHRRTLVTGIAAVVLLLPPLLPFAEFVRQMPLNNAWYNAEYVRSLRELVPAIRTYVPEGEPVVSDEVNSTPILAHTGHPILVQPKYEWTAARARLQEYREVATLGTPAELAGFLRQHQARYLVYSWRTLWSTRYLVGIPNSVNNMGPETALAQVVRDPSGLPGFELLWKGKTGRHLIYRLSAN